MLKFAVATAASLLLTTVANARSHPGTPQEFCGDRYCGGGFGSTQSLKPQRQSAPVARCSHHGCKEARSKPKRIHKAPTRIVKPSKGGSKIAVQIMPHPPGCPRTSFCGCGTALHIFGKNVREAWLARWWFRFPPSTPGPGKVAVRRHHVFAILKDLGGGKVLAYDPNSGRHKTRIWVRSLAGYSVRNPHGSRLAQS